jgi:hypothetical protein
VCKRITAERHSQSRPGVSGRVSNRFAGRLLLVYRRSILPFEPVDLAGSDDGRAFFLIFCQAVKMLAGVPASWIAELLMIPFSTVFD